MEFEIKIHGRGGQGSVTLARLIAFASFYDGYTPQAFPAFGAERTGAPVEAFVRLDKKFIQRRDQIYHPDIIIIQDDTLLQLPNIFTGISPNTKLIINTTKKNLKIKKFKHIFIIDADNIAQRFLGKPIPNTAILAFVAKEILKLKETSIIKAIKEHFHSKQNIIDDNIKIIKYIYEENK